MSSSYISSDISDSCKLSDRKLWDNETIIKYIDKLDHIMSTNLWMNKIKDVVENKLRFDSNYKYNLDNDNYHIKNTQPVISFDINKGGKRLLCSIPMA